MTPTIFTAVVLLLVAAALLLTRRRGSHRRRSFDPGAVSTSWLAELRRDEPWSR
jgi:uncharacterized protein (TIGR03382 family)